VDFGTQIAIRRVTGKKTPNKKLTKMELISL
jgi:hypothetical protein